MNQGDFGGAFDAVRGGHVTVLDEPVVLVVECEHTEDIVSYGMEGVWRVLGGGYWVEGSSGGQWRRVEESGGEWGRVEEK